MDDLISRTAAKQAIMQAHAWVDNDDMDIACEQIDAAPTVPAEVVRHGYWKRDDTWHDLYFCSACIGRDHYNKPKHKYCPDCGARMDLDAKEEENG